MFFLKEDELANLEKELEEDTNSSSNSTKTNEDDPSSDNDNKETKNNNDQSNDNDTSNDDSNNEEDFEKQAEEEKEEKNDELHKKVIYFDNFKQLLTLIDNFLESVDKTKDSIENDSDNEREIELSNYLIDELNISKKVVEDILNGLINRLNSDKLISVFSSLTTKVKLLIDLFKKLNETN